MKLGRKFFRTVSLLTPLLVTSSYILPPINVKCEEHPPNPSYVAGKGSLLIDCIKNQDRTDFREIRNFIGVRDTTMPESRYGVVPGGVTRDFIGSYDVINNVATFDTGQVMVMTSGGETAICFILYNHEVVHAFLNGKSQEMGNGKWPRTSTNDRRRFTLDDYGMWLVSEGLATYIADGHRIRNIYTKWPVTREEFYCSDLHDLGNYLITPIMNEFGKEAIPVLIENPPRGAETVNPKQWRDSIIERIHRARLRR